MAEPEATDNDWLKLAREAKYFVAQIKTTRKLN